MPDKLLFPDGNRWPYGSEPNRPTLEAFLAYAHEQGVTRRRLSCEELFPKKYRSRSGFADREALTVRSRRRSIVIPGYRHATDIGSSVSRVHDF